MQDISNYRVATSGERDASVAEACLVLGLAFTYGQLFVLARKHLVHAADLYKGQEAHNALELVKSTLKIIPR